MKLAAILLLVVSFSLGRAARAATDEETGQVASLLQQAEQVKQAGHGELAHTFYEAVLFIDPANLAARQKLAPPTFSVWRKGLETLPPVPPAIGVPDQASAMQMLRFQAVSTTQLMPALNPQLVPHRQ